MNAEKLIEWGGIALLVILGVRWLMGLMPSAGLSGLRSNAAPEPAFWTLPSTGVIVMGPSGVYPYTHNPYGARRWRQRPQ
jgi:hypothetical protein